MITLTVSILVCKSFLKNILESHLVSKTLINVYFDIVLNSKTNAFDVVYNKLLNIIN